MHAFSATLPATCPSPKAGAPVTQPWGCYLWREQGPELLSEWPGLEQRKLTVAQHSLGALPLSAN